MEAMTVPLLVMPLTALQAIGDTSLGIAVPLDTLAYKFDIVLRGRDATPVLIVTAQDALVDRVAGLDAGADDYLVKPFSPLQLIETIGELPLAA